MKKVFLFALVILLVGVLFISCGKKEEPAKVTPAATPAAAAPVATPAPSAEPVVFSLINGAEPESLDPHQIHGVPEHRLYEGLFEALVANDPETADAVPGIAESWDVSADGTQYTFHL